MKFSRRLRCIANATERRLRGKRRSSCFELLSTGLFPKVDPLTLVELEKADTAARREAARAGRTQPKSCARVRTFDVDDDIIHVVKRRRISGKQPADRLVINMYLPRQIVTK